jgi:transcriptional regulator with XRE-family HTH domain
VQFRTTNGLCRRCHASLDPEEPIIAAPEPAAESTCHAVNGCGLQVATAIRTLRQRNGMSQRQLALRMRVPRTYVSKIENEKATPTLSSLERLAEALRVSVPDLLTGASNREAEVRELVSDPFIGEIVPYLTHLSAMQMGNVLSQVRDMSLQVRKSA